VKNQGTKTCLMLFWSYFYFVVNPPGTFAQGVTETTPTAPVVTPPRAGAKPSPTVAPAQPKLTRRHCVMLSRRHWLLMMTILDCFFFTVVWSTKKRPGNNHAQLHYCRCDHDTVGVVGLQALAFGQTSAVVDRKPGGLD